jgi:hypothetical protein
MYATIIPNLFGVGSDIVESGRTYYWKPSSSFYRPTLGRSLSAARKKKKAIVIESICEVYFAPQPKS